MSDAVKSKSVDDLTVPTVNEQDRQRKLTPPPSPHSPRQGSPSGSPHHHSHNIQIIPLMEPKRQSPTHLRTPPRSPRPVSWQGQDIHIIPLMEPKQPAATPPPPPPLPSSDHALPAINRIKKSHSPRPVSWHPQALASRTSPKQQPPEVKIIPLMTPNISHATVVSSTPGKAPSDLHKKNKPKETMNSPLGPPISSANDTAKKQNKARKKVTIESPIGPMVVSVDDEDSQKARYRSMDRQGGLGPAPISFDEY